MGPASGYDKADYSQTCPLLDATSQQEFNAEQMSKWVRHIPDGHVPRPLQRTGTPEPCLPYTFQSQLQGGILSMVSSSPGPSLAYDPDAAMEILMETNKAGTAPGTAWSWQRWLEPLELQDKRCPSAPKTALRNSAQYWMVSLAAGSRAALYLCEKNSHRSK